MICRRGSTIRSRKSSINRGLCGSSIKSVPASDMSKLRRTFSTWATRSRRASPVSGRFEGSRRVSIAALTSSALSR